MTKARRGPWDTAAADIAEPALLADNVEPLAPEPTVSHRAASGVFWLTAQKWTTRLAGFVTIAILTRLLSPQDFGVVAAASTVLPFFYLLADLGFAAYIVQVEKTNQRMLSTGFWFSSIAGVGLCGALVAFAPVLGEIFRDERVVPILQVQALWVLLTAVASVPTALLRRSMRFATIAGQGAVAAVVAQCVAVAMAFAGLGAWALVAQGLVGAGVGSLMAWVVARWRPSLQFSRRDFRAMSRFGGQVLGVEFVAMARAWAEAAIISAVLGMSGLGYWNIAQRLVQVVQDLTGGALVPVTSVAFAKVRESSSRLREAYLRALRVTYAVISLPLTLVAVAAPVILPIAFGDGWSHAFEVTQILALAATLTVGAALDNGMFYGLGKPGRWFIYAIIVDAATVASDAVMSQWGLVAVAIGFLAIALTATIVRWFLVAQLLKTGPRVVASPFGFLVVAVVAAGGVGWGVVNLTAGIPGPLALVIVGVAMLAAHVVVLRLLARQVIDEGIAFVSRSGWAKLRLRGPKKSGDA